MPCYQAILPDRGLELTIPRRCLMNELILSITIAPLEEGGYLATSDDLQGQPADQEAPQGASGWHACQ